MDLPIHLLKFWYLESIQFFIIIWKNSLAVIEEDLALTLMVRLLFVPLFHDVSLGGRVIGILFRLSRIFSGLIIFVVVTFVLLATELAFIGWPGLLILPETRLLGWLILFIGLVTFLWRYLLHPSQTVSQIHEPRYIFHASHLIPSHLNWQFFLKSPEIQDLCWRLEFDPQLLPEPESFGLSPQLLDRALALAKVNNARYVTEMYFWVATISYLPGIEQLLMKSNLKIADFDEATKFLETKRVANRPVWIWDRDFGVRHLKGVNRGWLAAPTPALEAISTDLTQKAIYTTVDRFVGREKQLHQVIELLSSQNDQNVLLVGRSGTGKTTLVQYLARQIVTGDAPASMATKRLVQLDLSKLLSGARTQGDVADRVKKAFEEIKFFENIIVFVDKIENLAVGDAAREYNLLGLIEPYLESANFQFIAATDEASFQKNIEPNQTLVRVFHRVDLPPATVEETTEFLYDHAISIEKMGLVKFSVRALKAMSIMADRLIHDRVLPDSALSILRQCQDLPKTTKPLLVTVATVKDVLGTEIQIPLIEVDDNNKDRLMHLEDQIHKNLIDQEEAVKAVSDTLRRAAVELREPHRPIGSFLFVGPTGVGKTELAKQLAEIYFSQKQTGEEHSDVQGNFIRFDMSEYQTSSSIDRLIGSTEVSGTLTESVGHKPYSLILLDEFEKADPKVLTLFLQVLDDGELTDFTGKKISFVDTIIIATSNVASLTIADALSAGKTVDEIKPKVQQELLQTFKPELINRFDDIVIFKPLSHEDLQKVVNIKLAAVKKLLLEGGYEIEFSPELVSELAKRGFDPVLGARPLRRLIQDTIESKMSKMILNGDLVKGQVYKADVDLLE